MTLIDDNAGTASGPRADAPTREELIERVRSLAPLIKKNAAANEQNRRLDEETVEALAAAGLFKLWVPRRYGGYEVSVRTMLDVCAEVGAADGGASWVVTLLNGSAWLVSLFSGRAQDEVFGTDPEAKVSGTAASTATTVKVDGGYRVSGRWYNNSGSPHSTWAVLAMPVTDEDGEVVDQGLGLFSRQDLTLEDTWFVAGMKSSASNCLVAEDVFVPDHRLLSVSRAIEGDVASEHLDREPLYRSAFAPLLALILAGPQLGLGRAAVDYVREHSPRRSIPHSFDSSQSESVAFQLQLARAAQMVDTAHFHVERAAADLDTAAERSEHPEEFIRARVRADTGLAAEQITGAIDILLHLHGAGSFADVNPLQRIWRDSAVAARHGAVTPQLGFELYGKLLAGSPERTSLL